MLCIFCHVHRPVVLTNSTHGQCNGSEKSSRGFSSSHNIGIESTDVDAKLSKEAVACARILAQHYRAGLETDALLAQLFMQHPREIASCRLFK